MTFFKGDRKYFALQAECGMRYLFKKRTGWIFNIIILYLKKMGKKCIICESKNDGKKRPSVISFYKIQHQRRNDKQNRWISAVKEFDPAIVVKNE